MSDAPPPGLGPLLTPDGITGISLAVMASFVSALQANVRGWGVLTNAVAASVLTAVVVPPAVKNGYTWADYLGLICLTCGICATAVFMIIALVGKRALERGDKIADGLLDRVVGKENGRE